jgi:hypothetical protein
MKAWKGSRLKMVGRDVLPTYKRVVAWFQGLPEDAECLFQQLRRLNQGLNTCQWRMYECSKEPNGVCLAISIDSLSAAALEEMKWCPFRAMWDRQPSPFLVPNQK